MLFVINNNTIEDALKNAYKILLEIIPNFQIPTISRIKLTNASSYWANIGRDINTPDSFAIHISKTFEKIPDISKAKIRFQSCMIHEIIHTIPGCNNHGKKFKKVCHLINSKYPEYQLQRTTSFEDFGIPKQTKIPKYICHCSNCNKEYIYFKKPKYPIFKYTCKCGSNKLELLPYTNNT